MKESWIEFQAKIMSSEIGSGGAYVEFPFDVRESFGKEGRIKVIALFEDTEYRGSLVRMGTKCHILIIQKSIRRDLKKEIGDMVRVRVKEDQGERVVDMPQPLAEKLKACNLYERFENLSYTKKKEFIEAFMGAKKEETRERRFQKLVESIR